MPIQYRCRCGQEVVLRQRESVYLVVALILALTLVNTVFAVLLWNRLGALEEREPVVIESADATPTESLPVTPARLEPDPVPSVVEPPAVVAEEPPAPVRKEPARPEEAELARPDGLDSLTLLHLLSQDHPPVVASSVHLAAVAWTRGPLRTRAVRALRTDGLGALLPSLFSRGEEPILLEFDALPGPGHRLREIASSWQDTWGRLLPARKPSSWLVEARTALSSATDNVVVVDLTQSMERELPRIIEALQLFVSMTDRQHRWGWIGYRDEVVESYPLTEDIDAFVESLSEAWECGDGGDVPEGLDRALFAGLRFGAFEWNETARHRFIVVGDAPPPYERIGPMVSLVEAAASSPEKHEVHCLGILREEEYRTVPGFRELAEASSGRTIFIDEGESVVAALWTLITDARDCQWDERPKGYLE